MCALNGVIRRFCHRMSNSFLLYRIIDAGKDTAVPMQIHLCAQILQFQLVCLQCHDFKSRFVTALLGRGLTRVVFDERWSHSICSVYKDDQIRKALIVIMTK